MDTVVSVAIQKLFKSPEYLPLNPFKTVIHSLLSDEVSSRLKPKEIDLINILDDELSITLQLVAFGDSGWVGSKHLSRLVNTKSLKYLKKIATRLAGVFNPNQPAFASHVKTANIEANFLEVYLIPSCLSSLVSHPRPNRVSIITEALIKSSSLDDSLTLFIRRILEETHYAEQSSSIVVASLRTETIFSDAKRVHEIDVSTMKTKRQYVLSILKAAVCDEGDIILEFYLINKATGEYTSAEGDDPIAFQTARATNKKETKETRNDSSSDISTTLIFVSKRYKLSYRDGNNQLRCFSLCPLECLITGVFAEARSAELYAKTYQVSIV